MALSSVDCGANEISYTPIVEKRVEEKRNGKWKKSTRRSAAEVQGIVAEERNTDDGERNVIGNKWKNLLKRQRKIEGTESKVPGGG